MTVFAVTRAGKGDVYSFKTVLMADAHPIVQYGDAIISSSDAIRQSLTMPECAAIAEKIGDAELAREIRDMPVEYKSGVTRLMDTLWERLEKKAPAPPADPAVVLQKIVSDRVATRHAGVHLRPRGDFEMSETAQNEANAGNKTEAAAAPAKARPIPKDPKYADTGVITLLADKEGKTYGADHNPKKPGSASHDRFAKYVSGQTVKEAKDLGIQNGDLDNDVKKGFISIA